MDPLGDQQIGPAEEVSTSEMNEEEDCNLLIQAEEEDKFCSIFS